MFGVKMFVWVLVGAIAMGGLAYWDATTTEKRRDVYLSQLDDDDAVPAAVRTEYLVRHGIYVGAGVTWVFLGCLLFSSELSRSARYFRSQIR